MLFRSAEAEGDSSAFQTSAWALLDLLTTVLLERNKDGGGLAAKDQAPVYEILLSQVAKIAKRLESSDAAGDSAFLPQLPATGSSLKGGTAGSEKSDMEQKVATKVGTVMAFGMQTTATEIDDS